MLQYIGVVLSQMAYCGGSKTGMQHIHQLSNLSTAVYLHVLTLKLTNLLIKINNKSIRPTALKCTNLRTITAL